MNMKNTQKTLRKIRRAEAAVAYATPKQAARLAAKIVKWKTEMGDD